MDAINLKAIHKKYGERPLKTYNTINFFQYYIWYPFIKRMRTIRPLNFMPYNKNTAVQELEQKTGWRSYGYKHGESLFTKLFQNYYLPTKFGYDKRRPHFSSLIVSGQMTRDEAIIKLLEPLYEPQELEVDIDYFCKKMRITNKQFNEFINAPKHYHTELPTWNRRYQKVKKIQSSLERVLGRRLNVYS